MQLPPQHALKGLVKHYLVLDQKAVSQQNYRMFSDGNPGLVFHLSDQLLSWNERNSGQRLQSRSFLYGQLTHYNTLATSGHLNIIVVVLQPYALFTHFNTRAFELNNNTAPLSDFFGQRAIELEEQVCTALNLGMSIDIIEGFLLKLIKQPAHLTVGIAQAITLIYQHQGMITIDRLLATVPITERQLERKFHTYIGTTPTRFAATIKLQHLLKLLQKQPCKEKITQLIYKSGYHDQAHLNHSFKKLTGLTPAHYKHTPHLLAINLMPV